MKKVQKLITLFLAFIVVLGLVSPNFVKANTQTDVVIHKIKMKDLNGWPKTPNADGTYPGVTADKKYDGTKIQNIQDYFGVDNEVDELDGVKFFYWEVNKTQYETMLANPQNYKNEDAVTKYLNNNTIQKQVTGATANKEGVKVTLTNGTDDEPKYYWFIEDIGSNIGGGNTLSGAAAVPFGLALPIHKADGSVFGTGDDKALHVYPKNTITIPKIDKNFANETGSSTGANYENYAKEKETISRTIGSKIPYNVKTLLPAKAKYKTLRWEDTMDKGLTFNKEVDVKITKVDGSVVETNEFTKQTDFNVVQNESGFVLTFTEAGLEKLIKKLDSSDYEIEFNYSATLNGEAVIDSPEENRIKLDYSNNPKTFNDPKENPTTPKENNGKYEIDVTKTWANGNSSEVPSDVEVTYFLYEKNDNAENDKVVATHKITAGSGNFNHTFTGLNKDKKYYVKELVKGYNATYNNGTTAATIAITNTKDNDNPTPLIPTNPKVVTHGKKFVKTDNHNADGANLLLGAEFVVVNKNAGENQGKFLALKDTAKVEADKNEYNTKQQAYLEAIANYNKLEKDAQTEQEKEKIETAKIARDIAFDKVRIDYEWTNEESKALKIISNTKGQFEVTGLEAGNYALVEKVAPVGYALRTDEIAFNVAKNSYTTSGNIAYTSTASNGLSSTGTDALQVINKKITIPQTGGIGTIIFTLVGLSVMAAAVIAIKRRREEEQEA